MNRWSGIIFKVNDLWVGTSIEKMRQKLENVLSSKNSDAVWSTASFSIVAFKDQDLAGKNPTVYPEKSHHGKAEIKNAERKRNSEEPVVDPKTLIHKSWVDPKLLQFKICLRNKHRRTRSPKTSPR